MIPFNQPPYTGNEDQYILDVMHGVKMSGDGVYTKKCHTWFEKHLPCNKALLTPSCTHALELAAILLNIQAGDEVIMPSYTFVSTANAFVLRGAKIVFVDIRPDTMNIDEEKIEQAITSKTKVIVPVHYAGVACEMDKIMALAEQYQLYVVEDAAQGMVATYKGKALGTMGHLAAYSFHDTKNYTSGGEGGLLIINDDTFVERAEIVREKGTNRSQFFRGMVDKYSWSDVGSSYLPSEFQAAYLWGQLEKVDLINQNRLESWNQYYSGLKPLQEQGYLKLPFVPEICVHNAHMFYIKVDNLIVRTKLIDFLNKKEIGAVFHYVPLHSSTFGKSNSTFWGSDLFTTQESERIIRLPLWYGLKSSQIKQVIEVVRDFFNHKEAYLSKEI